MLFDAQRLIEFAVAILAEAGLDEEMSRSVAKVLVEGDLLGHTTHGLALLPSYVAALRSDKMTKSGSWSVLSDSGAVAAWDGNRLPGPWLVEQAITEACKRVESFGIFSLAIRRSHHIACLAAYLKPVTDRGLVVLLASSDPAVASVAPFGSTKRLYSPNPLAAGIPTDGEPLLIDISMSMSTNGFVNRAHRRGEQLPHAYVLDASGKPTTDPSAYVDDPGGSLLPLGGLETGYKGFALGLLIEALTSGLGGGGRSLNETGWGASVFLLVIDPNKFGGLDAFRKETGFLVHATQEATPIEPNSPARLPGARALEKRKQQLANGVVLDENLVAELEATAKALGIPLPPALSDNRNSSL